MSRFTVRNHFLKEETVILLIVPVNLKRRVTQWESTSHTCGQIRDVKAVLSRQKVVEAHRGGTKEMRGQAVSLKLAFFPKTSKVKTSAPLLLLVSCAELCAPSEIRSVLISRCASACIHREQIVEMRLDYL